MRLSNMTRDDLQLVGTNLREARGSTPRRERSRNKIVTMISPRANTGLLNNHRQNILFSIGPGAREITMRETSGLNALEMLSHLALSEWVEQEQVRMGLNYSLHGLLGHGEIQFFPARVLIAMRNKIKDIFTGI